MKRELKFRVFDTEYNKYHWDQGDWSLGIKSGMVRGIYGEEFPEFIVEQYTGLKDRHGKEIFEGDLLSAEGVKDMEVRWNEKNVSFCLEHKDWVHTHYFYEAVNPEDCEIIGNIHQTP